MTGLVAWFTGLPSAGKSTLARRVAAELRGRGLAPVILDGDEVRAALVPPPGYDDASRAAFYETLARLASLLAGQGHAVLVAATAHRRAFREAARALAPRFVEVFVDTPAEVCRSRDTRGLYAAGVEDAPGVGRAYEPPTAPDLTVEAGDQGGAARVAERIAGLTVRT